MGYIYREEREGGTGLVWKGEWTGHEVEGGGGRFEGKKKMAALRPFTNRPPKGVGTARAGFSLHGWVLRF